MRFILELDRCVYMASFCVTVLALTVDCCAQHIQSRTCIARLLTVHQVVALNLIDEHLQRLVQRIWHNHCEHWLALALTAAQFKRSQASDG